MQARANGLPRNQRSPSDSRLKLVLTVSVFVNHAALLFPTAYFNLKWFTLGTLPVVEIPNDLFIGGDALVELGHQRCNKPSVVHN